MKDMIYRDDTIALVIKAIHGIDNKGSVERGTKSILFDSDLSGSSRLFERSGGTT